jgi:hypothetical protein
VTVKANNADIINNDYIPVRPSFRANITNDISIEASSLKMRLDGALVTPFTVANSDRDYTLIYQPTGDLEDETVGRHTISVEASDVEGGAVAKIISGLKVAAAGVGTRLDGPLTVYPASFSPARDRTMTIAYTLNQESAIALMIFGPSGETVWSRRFPAGTNGAMAGYNAVAFEGVADVGGTALGNGIYAVRIISGGKVIGKGHLVIYD